MLKPGMMLCDRYEILDVVGAGGMSIVYKARCHRLNRNVAIKVLKPEFSNDKNFVTKFRIEAQASAGLSHPNIVNVYDVYDDDGMYFIVMELVDGITLKEYIAENGRLPMDKAIDFSIQIASGLEAAHESHIIHRDIKPQNIIVSKNGNIKVTDFGIAKAASPNTLTSGAMGSVHYISPEQARGGYSDERSDIYSLGITMYEMVTGRVPFEGENNVSVALMHIQNDMISPRQYYPDIYSSFEKIILKATQKKPERRYLTASALIADLKRVQNNPNIDIVVSPTAITNSPTQEWTKEDVRAIRDGSAYKDNLSNDYANMQGNMGRNGNQYPNGSQTNTFQNPPVQNEMGELQPIGGLSTIPVNNKKIAQLLDEDPWEDEFDSEPVNTPPARKSGSIKKVQDYEEDEDDDDDSEMDPKLRNAVIIGGILAAVVVALVVIIFLSKLAGFSLFKNESKDKTTTASSDTEQLVVEEIMIDVVGVSEEAALNLLKDKGFINVRTEHVSNSDIQEGYVFEQSVEKGKVISVDYEIVLKVSAGADEVVVPDVMGYSDEQACTILREAGFEIKHAYDFSEDVPKDSVMLQNPLGNTMAPAGSTVIITISNGSEVKEVEVPNLNGLTEAQAINSLAKYKLVQGQIKHEYSDTVAEGYVMAQDIPAGQVVNEGDAVGFTISDGPEPKVVTFTAKIKTTITCNDSTLDGQAVTVQIIFNGQVVSSLDETVNAGSSYDIEASVPGLSSDSGSVEIVIVDASGTNVNSSFSVPYPQISYVQDSQ